MKASRLICLLLILVTVVVSLSHPEEKEDNGMRWGGLSTKQRDAYLFNLWEMYKKSPTQEIYNAVTKIAYLDSRIDMIGLTLFGPKNYRSILRAVRGENLALADDHQCLKSTMKLFEKHCGVVTEHRMKQSLANICNYVSEKAAIEEAIIVACAMHVTGSHGIDIGNPKIDFKPAPIHGTSQYCGRVSISGVSRMKLYSYAKSYKVTLVPSQLIHERYDNMIKVCFHRNDSQGLCQCEKDDWRSVQKGSWSSSISPYEQGFIDVKFIVQLPGSVIITLDEVSQGWLYASLIGGIALLYMAVSKDIFYLYVDDGILQFIKWAMLVLAVTCIFMSSIDTPLAMLAVASSLALYFVVTHVIAPMLSKKTKLWPQNELGRGAVDALQNGGSKGSQKYNHPTDRKIRNRMKLKDKEYEELPVQSVSEMASSPEFEEWVIKNAHRIRLRPKNG